MSFEPDLDCFLMQQFYLFSFMIEAKSELGQFYAQTKECIQQGGKDYVLTAIQTNIGAQSTRADYVRYQYRMCVSFTTKYSHIACMNLLVILKLDIPYMLL
jgi:hypothetical protein